MFDKLRTSNLGLGRGEKRRPVEFSNYVDQPMSEELAPKMKEQFELRTKYPGLDDELLTAIVDDPDPNNKAQVLATLDQALELQKQGKTPEEAVDILKETMFKRKDNAEGGLNYLMGM